jgi:hypothetical protein
LVKLLMHRAMQRMARIPHRPLVMFAGRFLFRRADRLSQKNDRSAKRKAGERTIMSDASQDAGAGSGYR